MSSGQQIIAEYAFGTAATSPTEQYVYGSYVDEPIIKDGTLSSGTGIVYYHHDRRFSVVALTDTSGAAVERYAYSPYGKLSIFNGSGSSISGTDNANTITYTGRQWDKEIELYYFRTRYFDQNIGRFLTRDPLGFVDGANHYMSYFFLNWTDPTGLKKACCTFDNGKTRWRWTLDHVGVWQRPIDRCKERIWGPWGGWGSTWRIIDASPGKCPSEGKLITATEHATENDNLGDLINSLKKKSKGCACIRTISLRGHGNPKGMELGNSDSSRDWNAVCNDKATDINVDNAHYVAARLRTVNLCKDCNIILGGCNSGLQGQRKYLRVLSTITGCKVIGPRGYSWAYPDFGVIARDPESGHRWPFSEDDQWHVIDGRKKPVSKSTDDIIKETGVHY